jgi:hypothetical protein
MNGGMEMNSLVPYKIPPLRSSATYPSGMFELLHKDISNGATDAARPFAFARTENAYVHRFSGTTKWSGRPRWRKRDPNMWQVFISADIARSRRAFARLSHRPAWQRPWFEPVPIQSTTTGGRASAGVTTASMDAWTAGVERRTATEEQPHNSSVDAPPLI